MYTLLIRDLISLSRTSNFFLIYWGKKFFSIKCSSLLRTSKTMIIEENFVRITFGTWRRPLNLIKTFLTWEKVISHNFLQDFLVDSKVFWSYFDFSKINWRFFTPEITVSKKIFDQNGHPRWIMTVCSPCWRVTAKTLDYLFRSDKKENDWFRSGWIFWVKI